jgi:hypothetical protein
MACGGALLHLNQATLSSQTQHRRQQQQQQHSRIQALADVALSGIGSWYVTVLTCR